jgi:hypothetical protein
MNYAIKIYSNYNPKTVNISELEQNVLLLNLGSLSKS